MEQENLTTRRRRKPMVRKLNLRVQKTRARMLKSNLLGYGTLLFDDVLPSLSADRSVLLCPRSIAQPAYNKQHIDTGLVGGATYTGTKCPKQRFRRPTGGATDVDRLTGKTMTGLSPRHRIIRSPDTQAQDTLRGLGNVPATHHGPRWL